MSYTRPPTYVDFNIAGQLCWTVGWFFSGRIDQRRFEHAAQELARQWPEVAGVLRMETEDPKSLVLDVPDKENAKMWFGVKDLKAPLASTHTAAPRANRIRLVYPSPAPALVSALGMPPFSELPSYFASPYQKQKNAIHVHLGLFKDASVISIWWAHILLDAGGLQAVVSALISLINDPSATLPPLLPGNPFEKFLKPGEGNPAQPVWRSVPPEGMPAYIEQGQKDMEIDGPMDFARLYFPRVELDRMKAEAKERVTDNDVISGYLWKTFCANLSDPPSRPTRLSFAVDIRSRLPGLFPEHSEQPYLGNAFTIVSADQTIPAGDVRRASIADISSRVRHLVLEQGTSQGAEAHLKWLAEVDGKGFALMWDAGDRTMYTTSWLRFGLGDLKISKDALVNDGTGKLLDMYFWMPTIPGHGAALLFKDEIGGIWCELSMGKKRFEEDAIRALF